MLALLLFLLTLNEPYRNYCCYECHFSGKLTGMTENCITVAILDRFKEPKLLIQKIIENINVAVIPSTDEDMLRFVVQHLTPVVKK